MMPFSPSLRELTTHCLLTTLRRGIVCSYFQSRTDMDDNNLPTHHPDIALSVRMFTCCATDP